jgi:hypothetical protein
MDYVKFSTLKDELFMFILFKIFLCGASPNELSAARAMCASWHVGTIAKRGRFP